MKFSNVEFIKTDVPKGIQAIINFDNYDLSIVQNECSYGNKQGLYEIAVFEGNEQVELPGITQLGDTVKGFLSEIEVDAILTKMFTITGVTGTQK